MYNYDTLGEVAGEVGEARNFWDSWTTRNLRWRRKEESTIDTFFFLFIFYLAK